MKPCVGVCQVSEPALSPECDYQKKQRESFEYEIKAMQIWVGYEIMGVKKITLNLWDAGIEAEKEKLVALTRYVHTYNAH